MGTTRTRRRLRFGRGGIQGLFAAVRHRGRPADMALQADGPSPARSPRTRWKTVARAGAATALVAGALAGATAGTARAATSGPCDIYAAGGTPCVAAHSTTRA